MKSLGLILSIFLGSMLSMAQLDDPAVAGINDIDPNRGPANVIGTFPTPAALGGTPVGLQASAGNLVITDIGASMISGMTDTGVVIPPTFSGVGSTIGIGTDGTFFYQTDTIADQVVVFDSAGVMQSSFPVAGQTTFPEGVTFNPTTGNLYVVNGSGGNMVHEYTTAGALVQSFPINGSSPDGIAFYQGTYYIYDSGTDSIRSYDSSFTPMDVWPGTIAAGYSGGEGLAVLNGRLFVVATGSDLVVEFGAVGAQVPTLSPMMLVVFAIGLVGIASFVAIRRRSQV